VLIPARGLTTVALTMIVPKACAEETDPTERRKVALGVGTPKACAVETPPGARTNLTLTVPNCDFGA
jgi:hypothetical protein